MHAETFFTGEFPHGIEANLNKRTRKKKGFKSVQK